MSDPSALTSEALAAIGKAQTPADLERIETEYLGRKSGRVSRLLSNIGQLPPQEKAALGKAANEAKRNIEAALAARRGERAAAKKEPADLHHHPGSLLPPRRAGGDAAALLQPGRGSCGR